MLAVSRFQSTPTGFPAGDPCRKARASASLTFQSTPTGFPAGDMGRVYCCAVETGFNPRRPVSRPATFQRQWDRLIAQVSIHADRFPGRRLVSKMSCSRAGLFQSTPTGFPAGDRPAE